MASQDNRDKPARPIPSRNWVKVVSILLGTSGATAFAATSNSTEWKQRLSQLVAYVSGNPLLYLLVLLLWVVIQNGKRLAIAVRDVVIVLATLPQLVRKVRAKAELQASQAEAERNKFLDKGVRRDTPISTAKEIKVTAASYEHSNQIAAQIAAPHYPSVMKAQPALLGMDISEFAKKLPSAVKAQHPDIEITVGAAKRIFATPTSWPRQEIWSAICQVLLLPADHFSTKSELTKECCVARLRRYHRLGSSVHTYAKGAKMGDLENFEVDALRTIVRAVEESRENERNGGTAQ